MDNTSGHLSNNPGLRGHSSDPSQDLLKQYVLSRRVKHGWLALASFNTEAEVAAALLEQPLDEAFRIVDQFNDIIMVSE